MLTNNSDLKHKLNFLQDNPVAAENYSFEDKNRAGCKQESKYLTVITGLLAASLIKDVTASESENLKLLDWVDHKLR